MKMKNKKLALVGVLSLGLIAASAGLLSFNYVSADVDETPAIKTAEGVSCGGASFRYKTSDADPTGNGLRLQVRITEEMAKQAVKTYTLVIPKDQLNGELTKDTPNVEMVETTNAWWDYTDEEAQVTTGKESYVYLWDIPEESYNREIAYRGVVEIGGEYYYSEDTKSRSLMYVAKEVLGSNKESQDAKDTAQGYILYTVTYELGASQQRETVAYGKKLKNVPTAEKEGFAFDGWYIGEEKINVEEYVVTADTTLTARYTDLEALVAQKSIYGGSKIETSTTMVYNDDSTTSVKFTIGDSGYKTCQQAIKSDYLSNIKKGSRVTYQFRIENLTGLTDNSKLHLSALMSPLGLSYQGTQNITRVISMVSSTNVPEATGDFVSTGQWYELSYISDKDYSTLGYLMFESRFNGAKGSNSWATLSLTYEMYVDCITISEAPVDAEESIVVGDIKRETNYYMSAERTKTDTYGADSTMAIRISTETNNYNYDYGRMRSNYHFRTFDGGYKITYYIKAESVEYSSTQKVADRKYTSQNTIRVKELVNPQYQTALPESITYADGAAINNGETITGEEELLVGVWYKVTYVATATNQNNGSFTALAKNGSGCAWVQKCYDTYKRSSFIIDGLTVTKP